MLNINNEEWGVVLVAPTNPKLQRSDGSWSIGTCDDYDKLIYINDSLPDVLMKKVVLHEIAHAIFFAYNYNLNSVCLREEAIVQLIEEHGEEIISLAKSVYTSIIRGRY